ncbi:MAG: hypothetical protein NVSMB42_25520 [Herpetosiphon sp.]
MLRATLENDHTTDPTQFPETETAVHQDPLPASPRCNVGCKVLDG